MISSSGLHSLDLIRTEIRVPVRGGCWRAEGGGWRVEGDPGGGGAGGQWGQSALASLG